jgi:hypothetical protein
MKRIRWVLFGLAIAIVIIASLLVLLNELGTQGEAGVTKEGFDRIKVGMSADEVSAIFGIKEDDALRRPRPSPLGVHRSWGDPDTGDMAMIQFDSNDCVLSMEWHPSQFLIPDRRSLWEKLSDRFLRRKREKHAFYLEVVD